jgi:GNAT superfamily N-acetyltransferase
MQRPAYTIRKAGAAETEKAIAMVGEYCDQVGVTVRDSRGELEWYLTAERSGIWLAWLDGSSDMAMQQDAVAIGCILLRPLSQRHASGEIKRLYVREDHRGQGVAQALLLALEQYACSHGMQWLYLDSKDDLQAALRFYQHSGYRRCNRYNDNPQATIFMRKQLRPAAEV